jgi:hypothetical protein
MGAGLNKFGLGKKTGTRTNEAHLSLEDIPELRKLIEFRPPQKPAEWCDR